MLVGLFKAIQRIIISAALNLLYLSRLDIALTVTGWEWLDKGKIFMDLSAITVHFFKLTHHIYLSLRLMSIITIQL